MVEGRRAGSEIARQVVKSQPCCKRVCQSIFCDLLPRLLVAVVGNMTYTPPLRLEKYLSTLHSMPNSGRSFTSRTAGGLQGATQV